MLHFSCYVEITSHTDDVIFNLIHRLLKNQDDVKCIFSIMTLNFIDVTYCGVEIPEASPNGTQLRCCFATEKMITLVYNPVLIIEKPSAVDEC